MRHLTVLAVVLVPSSLDNKTAGAPSGCVHVQVQRQFSENGETFVGQGDDLSLTNVALCDRAAALLADIAAHYAGELATPVRLTAARPMVEAPARR
jgi:hypothetical protein